MSPDSTPASGSSAPNDGELQFDSVVMAAPGRACTQCRRPLGAEYYAAGGQVVCASCKSQIEQQIAAGKAPSAMARAAIFGLGGAILGAALYYTVTVVTHFEIALITIVIGYLVGRAVRIGSRGIGGRRYQTLAVALTYLAVGASDVAIAVKTMQNQERTASAGLTSGATPATESRGGVLGTGFGIAGLVRLTVSLPVIEVLGAVQAGSGMNALITIIIVGVGLMQAWRMTAGINVVITGPHRVGAGPAAA